VQLSAIQQRDSHLIVAVTNYTRGTLEAFYVSPLIQQFVSADAGKPLDQQRIQHFRKLGTQTDLEKSLLASAAIPFFFPPVDINGDWYIDGV
jgi:predicted acylesterase/phospholipase RssA